MMGRPVMAGQKVGAVAAVVGVAMLLCTILTSKRLAYRIIPAFVALCSFLALSAIYLLDHRDTYMGILRLYGIDPFRFPFLDISGSLAAWDCARLGIDVVEHDPCDVLDRGYNYSPLWMTGCRRRDDHGN